MELKESKSDTIACYEVGYLVEEGVEPPILYYVGHPNHWNTSCFGELVKEISGRLGWPKKRVKDWLLERNFPEQHTGACGHEDERPISFTLSRTPPRKRLGIKKMAKGGENHE